MKYQKVTDPETVNKLYRLTRLQQDLTDFQNDHDCKVLKVILADGEYKGGTRSAQTSYHNAIKRMGLHMKARVLDGELYLIKLEG